MLKINENHVPSCLIKKKRINIILDNTRIHTAKMVQKVAEISNINLIYLKQYCPDLSPIENV
ncbi:transposase [Methanobrevibacter oralis]|uniref:transposase n=1 Tax=Methanobrevibacter oralis TaxID=66851 RepID=UPI0009EDAC3A